MVMKQSIYINTGLQPEETGPFYNEMDRLSRNFKVDLCLIDKLAVIQFVQDSTFFVVLGQIEIQEVTNDT